MGYKQGLCRFIVIYKEHFYTILTGGELSPMMIVCPFMRHIDYSYTAQNFDFSMISHVAMLYGALSYSPDIMNQFLYDK